MKEKRELTVFKAELAGVTWAEWVIKPSIGTAVKTALLGLGAVGLVVGAKYAVDWVDDTFKQTYIVNGNSPEIPMDTGYDWQRPIDWKRK